MCSWVMTGYLCQIRAGHGCGFQDLPTYSDIQYSGLADTIFYFGRLAGCSLQDPCGRPELNLVAPLLILSSN